MLESTRLRLTKYAMLLCLAVVNGSLIVGILFLGHHWYVWFTLLSIATVINCSTVFLVIGNALYFKSKKALIRTFTTNKSEAAQKTPAVMESKSYGLLIPCYNESEEELDRLIASFVKQSRVEAHKKLMLIVCDGRVKGLGEKLSTDQILLQSILKDSVDEHLFIPAGFLQWEGKWVPMDIYSGIHQGLPFLCIIKHLNVGKRDSLVLIRRALHLFNQGVTKHAQISTHYLEFCLEFMQSLGIEQVDYLVGTDGDTYFDELCSYELLQSIAKESIRTVGVCGYVELADSCPAWSPWSLYQSSEYTYAQCLRRLQQSKVTHKVSCMPGCVQLLRVQEETCGDAILDAFNRLPQPGDSILRYIRATASEDRNHVCLMLHMFPYVHTKQSLRAIAYTVVPNSFSVFYSQRRRWSLGATSNDIFLAFSSGINFFERIVALVNVGCYSLCSFIFVATGFFIYAMIVHPSMFLLLLSIPLLVPWAYCMCIPFMIPMSTPKKIRYWIGYFMYLILGPFVGVTIHLYAVFNADTFSWGKTRQLAKEDPVPVEAEAVDVPIIVEIGANVVSDTKVRL